MKWFALVLFGLPALLIFSMLNKIDRTPADLYQFTPADACKATLAIYNNRDPNTMRVSVDDADSKKSSVSYTRDDGKHFVYDCRISGDRLSFRTRQGTGVGKPDGVLRVGPADGGVLTVTLRTDSTLGDSRSFRHSDLR